MFCANTRPVPDASTDFGEMSPPIVRTRDSRPRSEAARGVARAAPPDLAWAELEASTDSPPEGLAIARVTASAPAVIAEKKDSLARMTWRSLQGAVLPLPSRRGDGIGQPWGIGSPRRRAPKSPLPRGCKERLRLVGRRTTARGSPIDCSQDRFFRPDPTRRPPRRSGAI